LPSEVHSWNATSHRSERSSGLQSADAILRIPALHGSVEEVRQDGLKSLFLESQDRGKRKSDVERTNFYIEREQARGDDREDWLKAEKALSERYGDNKLAQRWINNTEEEQ
jgi:hypothetical protein